MYRLKTIRLNFFFDTNKMEETQISIEELQKADLGGNAFIVMKPELLKEPKIYTVKSASGVKTEYGVRIEYIIADSNTEYKLSSWNLIMKEKVKALELINKKIKLSRSDVSEKKINLEILA